MVRRGTTILKEASTKGKPYRKDGTQSYGPSRQRSSYEHCDKGKPGVTPGRKAFGSGTSSSLDIQMAEPPQRLMVAESLDALYQTIRRCFE